MHLPVWVLSTQRRPSLPPSTGSYFKNLGAVIKTYPSLFSTVAAAAKKAGLADKLTGATFAETIFLPTNEAFKKAGVDLEKTDKVRQASQGRSWWHCCPACWLAGCMMLASQRTPGWPKARC